MFNQEAQQRTFNDFMQRFVLPEIERRKEASTLPDGFVLEAAQVVFSEEDGSKIRLNHETKIMAKARVTRDVEKGDIVLTEDVGEINHIGLTDEEEADYAHFSVFKLGNKWFMGFDFRYNKRLAREHVKTAEQFYKVAQFSYENKLMVPFIDNLFSCIELLAKSELLLMPVGNKPIQHRGIHSKYNNFVKIGNSKKEFKTALNKLSNLRSSARYLKGDFDISDEDAAAYLSVAEAMFSYMKTRLIKHSDV